MARLTPAERELRVKDHVLKPLDDANIDYGGTVTTAYDTILPGGEGAYSQYLKEKVLPAINGDAKLTLKSDIDFDRLPASDPTKSFSDEHYHETIDQTIDDLSKQVELKQALA